MHPADIQAEIKKKGLTQKALAERIGVSENTLSQVIRKNTVSDRIMGEVARLIGKPRVRVFPEYYLGPKHRSTSKAQGQQG